MFYLTYLVRELQRRWRQTALSAAGLAIGVGLVLAVTGAAAGMASAESQVLHALYGIGTDITITKAAAKTAPRKGLHAFSPGSQAEHEDLLSPIDGLAAIDASAIRAVRRLPGVAAVAGGLLLTDSQFTVPSLSQLGPNGQPPKSAYPTTFTVDGVDLSHLGLGPLASHTIGAGRDLRRSDAGGHVAVVDATYARANGLSVGSNVTIASTSFTVVGIVRQAEGGGASDVYIPLSTAQELARTLSGGLRGQVNVIYVAAASASDVSQLQAEIGRRLPSATVTGSSSLASEVSGSMATVSRLIDELGRWLAVLAVLASIAVASLLATGAVTRRVRELGTLRAMGWRVRRVVGQILGEGLAVGAAGAVLGIALGIAGTALINAAIPPLTATVAANPGSSPPRETTLNGTGQHHPLAPDALHTVAVHLAAHVTGTEIAAAVLLSLAGAMIASSLAAWRAARLRPAVALAQIG